MMTNIFQNVALWVSVSQVVVTVTEVGYTLLMHYKTKHIQSDRRELSRRFDEPFRCLSKSTIFFYHQEFVS